MPDSAQRHAGTDLEKLYADNRRLLAFWARHYRDACEQCAAVDGEDLMQSGFVGLMRASATYDPTRSRWSTWASYYIRQAMRAELGLQKRSTDPVMLSLDAPAYSDEDDTTLIETVADESGPNADELLLCDEVVRVVREAIWSIDDAEASQAIVMAKLEGRSHAEVAEAMGESVAKVSAMLRRGMKRMAHNRKLRSLTDLDAGTRYYAHKGVEAFYSSGSSVVEDAVIWREGRRKTLP